jgi:hypothetical protein
VRFRSLFRFVLFLNRDAILSSLLVRLSLLLSYSITGESDLTAMFAALTQLVTQPMSALQKSFDQTMQLNSAYVPRLHVFPAKYSETEAGAQN